MSSEEYNEEIPVETDSASCLTASYLSSLGPRKNGGEFRRAWATLLFVSHQGFPMNMTELQAVDALVRYLEGGFAGPRAE